MKALKKLKKLFASDDKGATALEYALLGSLIAAAIVLSVQNLGITVGSFFARTSAVVDEVIGK